MKNKKKKIIREVRNFPSEWDLADLLKACEKAHTAFQVVGEQKECCTNSPSSQTDVQNRFFTADEMAIFCHVTVSWEAIKHILTSVQSLEDEDGHLPNRDRDKAEVFNAFFASAFRTDDGPGGSQCPELEDHDYGNDQLPVDPDIVQDLLLQLDPYKSMGPDGIPPRILKELLMSSHNLS